ncbi:Nucleoside-diphosphate-sugar epimerase [Microbulbifer thermotolerans]|uniref:NAD-dependent epimerase/dehydratase family protein n=1 Tax=Microbulbifer thermotolerans TaxID=252514 RepID=UPI0008E6962D|nr:NAD(P)-dependent oxidoreductase [Microbulbifer thermotolerans]MCX2795143.1 NAD(P)-dependent oxidoreductase [Microbulbifer thermotolerans]MCX2834490.1 NAD(P)-dependent oxidoreductase [Microbulbifer thermotolerans]WKT61967.1 NAD(P)-dependent oxidoreductase [Microbulbifer thermotolerans]SFC95350.1 Nucleoside-diphosphate-sugar epimerase [Microbulbifer thermotolerans]
MARWVVVGGTGYIGRALCRRLNSSGWRVLSVSRAPDGPVGCKHLSLQLSPGSDFSHIFQAGDRVVYAAGLASRAECERHPRQAYWLNSDCPLMLLRCAERAGAESFTYISSVKAKRPPRGRVAGEDDGVPATDVYGHSKWLGERLLLAELGNCRVNLIRSASVYGIDTGGRGSRGRAGRWLGLLGFVGNIAPLLPASGRRSFISLSDLVQAIVLLAEAQHCNRQVFIAAEPTFYDLAAIVSAIRGARVRASSRLMRLLLAAARPLRRLPIARTLLELEESELYSAARLRKALRWRAEERYCHFLRSIS